MTTAIHRTLPLSLDQFLAYNKAGPRYTSYPTAVEFSDSFDQVQYQEILAEADKQSEKPLSVYTHLPFCLHKCLFCACNMIVAKDASITKPYLHYLEKDYHLHAKHLPSRRKISQYHWGGGTPTYLETDQMLNIIGWAKSLFDFDQDTEVSVEVHPKTTTEEKIYALASAGFNRISLGVQDLSPQVQQAIERFQTVEQTQNVLSQARKAGFTGINIDLVYGLPEQNLESFAQSIDLVLEMKPDRVALYSFGYVPWLEGAQRKIFEQALPNTREKFSLFLMAFDKFIQAGYVQIGIDHFALPDDELAQAQENGTLMRNFMGYTTKRSHDMIGLGISSIGNIGGSFAQYTKKIPRYYNAIDAGRFPIEKGLLRTPDDNVRAVVIEDLMCNFQIDIKNIEALFDIEFAAYFQYELDNLQGYEQDGMVEYVGDKIKVTDLGRFFVRNLAMVFDAHLENRLKSNSKGVFSQTI